VLSGYLVTYGGLLFTTALYLQDTLHDSPLRSGLTFAAYAAGFAAASLTWTRLPATWRDRFPAWGSPLSQPGPACWPS